MGKRILLVDDEASSLLIAQTTLESNGYEVITAFNGSEAVDLAKETHPDLIIMDIMMPEMDGAQAVRVLKENNSTKSIPVIFLTSMVSKEEESSMKITIVDQSIPTIAKPCNPDEFIDLIQATLKEN